MSDTTTREIVDAVNTLDSRIDTALDTQNSQIEEIFDRLDGISRHSTPSSRYPGYTASAKQSDTNLTLLFKQTLRLKHIANYAHPTVMQPSG